MEYKKEIYKFFIYFFFSIESEASNRKLVKLKRNKKKVPCVSGKTVPSPTCVQWDRQVALIEQWFTKGTVS